MLHFHGVGDTPTGKRSHEGHLRVKGGSVFFSQGQGVLSRVGTVITDQDFHTILLLFVNFGFIYFQ